MENAGRATGKFTVCFREIILLAVCVLAATACGDRTGDKTQDDPLTTIVDYSAPTGVLRKQAPEENVLKFVDASNVLIRQLFSYGIGPTYCCDVYGSDKNNAVYGFYNSSRLLGMLAVGADDDMATEIGNAIVPGLAVKDWLSVSCSIEGSLGISGAPPGGDVHFSKSSSAEIFDRYRLARDFLDNLVNGFGTTFKPFTLDDPQYNRRRLTLSDSTDFSASLAGTSADVLPHDGLFEKLDGTQVWAPMVSISGEYPTFENDQLKAVEIPFNSNGLSLLIIMPNKSSYISVENGFRIFHMGSYFEVEDGIQTILPEVLSGMKTSSVKISVPAFSADECYNLDDFRYSQLWRAFSEGSADFSKINGVGYLYVDKASSCNSVLFSGSILKGSGNANADLYATKDEPSYLYGLVTGLNITNPNSLVLSCPSHYVPAGTAEARPFIFLIRHRDTGLIMQMGRIVKVDGKDAGEWVCDDTPTSQSGQ
ncbi:MAG: hypothetical protein HZA20_05635 [Nitrospirae bacterium]|nr:hypothetical protein [Nitrospirota bacterium]